MISRRRFLQAGGQAALGSVFLAPGVLAGTGMDFESKRPPVGQRRFTSEAVEAAIKQVKNGLKNKELAWLFENCFPNTLDTTVDFSKADNKPDTYVITGDIDAMWLRDSTAQVWPYLSLISKDQALKELIAGVINRQTRCILLDRYANAFFKDGSRESEWMKTDHTDMKPGIHERKWEIDSLCYPIRLAYRYWKDTGDAAPFDASWKEAIRLTLQTFKEQQRINGKGPYHFQRTTSWATDGVPLMGYGYPVKPVGLICSIFRPSDDATIFPFLVPANFFAVVSLKQAAEMVESLHKDAALAADCRMLAATVEKALSNYAVATHPRFGKVYAYEVNGFGSYNLMDDANVPSLLSLPYLGAINPSDPVYNNTRKLILSEENPFYFKGKAGDGIGSPHTLTDTIWPISVTVRALTSRSDDEILACMRQLVATHGGTGFMHESFHKDDASKFTRKWFAWANTLFGELVLKLFHEKKALLMKV